MPINYTLNMRKNREPPKPNGLKKTTLSLLGIIRIGQALLIGVLIRNLMAVRYPNWEGHPWALTLTPEMCDLPSDKGILYPPMRQVICLLLIRTEFQSGRGLLVSQMRFLWKASLRFPSVFISEVVPHATIPATHTPLKGINPESVVLMAVIVHCRPRTLYLFLAR